MPRSLIVLLSLAVGAVSLAACLDSERIRGATYPRDFHYITREEIRETMTALAYWIDELDEIMEREGGPEARDRVAVIEILEQIQERARELKRAPRSNHPRIDRNAESLQRDADFALDGARRNPPNYYWAGQLSGACEYCHVPRHGQATKSSGQGTSR